MKIQRIATNCALLSALLVGGCGGSDQPASSSGIGSIVVLSNRADLVSGDDAMVEIIPATGIDVSKLSIDVDGVDVTPSFKVRDGRFTAMVTGLKSGLNTLSARLPDGPVTALSITNHSRNGPVLYGPQVAPWSCDPGATDVQCNRPVQYSFKYVSSDPALTGLLPYDPSNPATDVATTTTSDGTVVPFIVRIETEVLNRDYYNVAVLFDVTKAWTPWEPQAAWNRSVVVAHGAGCGTGYKQTNVVAGDAVLDLYALSRGFAVLSVALIDSGHNCNVALQAESLVMAKEQFIETYGEILHIIGYGTLGGALAAQWMSNAYPSLYDGIVVEKSYPDLGSTVIEIEDCSLFRNFFNGAGSSWSPAMQAAVQGHLDVGVCMEWVDFIGFHNMFDPHTDNIFTFLPTAPTAAGGCDVPSYLRYDSTFNPTGVRCTIQDYAVGLFGRRVDTFANRPYSNVGVQYGYTALIAGTITPAQFVELNYSIGSHDIDYRFQSRRVAADPGALDATYRTGFVNGGHGMQALPIIDIRDTDVSGIHHQYRAWAMRARLERANGTHGNHVIWYDAGTTSEALDLMQQWIHRIKSDTTTKAPQQKAVDNRPADAADRCGALSGTGLTMRECTGVSDGSTRMAAGQNLADDVVECQLKPLDRASYPVTFTDIEWSQLESVFPTGVCDSGKAGKGQQPVQPWQTYVLSNGSVVFGGVPLGASPVSR